MVSTYMLTASPRRERLHLWRQSEVIRGTQRHSEAPPVAAIRGHQRQSEVIRGSTCGGWRAAIRRNQGITAPPVAAAAAMPLLLQMEPLPPPLLLLGMISMNHPRLPN